LGEAIASRVVGLASLFHRAESLLYVAVRSISIHKPLQTVELARILAKRHSVSDSELFINRHISLPSLEYSIRRWELPDCSRFRPSFFSTEAGKRPAAADKYFTMDVFFQNAHRILDTAGMGMDSGNDDFALLVGADGGLHFIMETPFSIEAAAIHAGAQAAYQITRSREGVRVKGRSMGRDCVLEHRTPRCVSSALLPDQPLYRITSPALTS
jgi:hypothetical protein